MGLGPRYCIDGFSYVNFLSAGCVQPSWRVGLGATVWALPFSELACGGGGLEL